MSKKVKKQITNIQQDSNGLDHLVTIIGRNEVSNLDPATRAIINMGYCDEKYTAGDMMKIVAAMKGDSQFAVFNGEMDKGPRFYLSYVTAVSKYNFRNSDMLEILQAKLGGIAKTWFTELILNIGINGSSALLSTILKKFKQQYMNATHARVFRQKLQSCRLTNFPSTIEELHTHFSLWNSHKVNLVLCEPSADEETLMPDFLTSLPSSLANLVSAVSHLGDRIKSINVAQQFISDQFLMELERRRGNVNQPTRIKTEAHNIIMGNNQKVTRTQAFNILFGDDIDYVSLDGAESYVFALDASLDDDGDNVDHDGFTQDQIDHCQSIQHYVFELNAVNVDEQKAKCFHCGLPGHRVGVCKVALAKQPQTAAGQAVWAAMNKLRGEPRVYDVEKQLQYHRMFMQRMKARQEKRSASQNAKPTNQSSYQSSFNKATNNNSTTSRVLRSSVASVVTDDDVADPDDKTLIQASVVVENGDEFEEVESREQSSSTSLCLPLELVVSPHPPVSVGYALKDQGCVHTLIRGSFKDKVCPHIPETPVRNHYVVGATSNIEVPIRSKFLANLSSNSTSLGRNKTVVYVVDDSVGRDIMCDVIIGRPTLAESDYHCIDTKKATMFNRQTNKQIQCMPACFVNTRDGRKVVPRELEKTAKASVKNHNE
jgi:hypothetical protein